MSRVTTLLNLIVGVLTCLAHDLSRLFVGFLTLIGRIGVGLFTGVLRLANQFIGLLLGGSTALLEVGEQLVDFLGGLILLSGNVGTNLFDLGSDLAHRVGAVDLGLVGDLLSLGLGSIGDLAGLALGLGHHLGHLLAYIGQLLVGIGERRFDLVIGIGLELGDFLVGVLAQLGGLPGRFGPHLGDFALLRRAFGGKLLIVFLTGVAELKFNGLTLLGDVLGGLSAQLGGILVGGSGD